MMRFNMSDAVLLIFLILLLLPLYGTSDSVEGQKETNAEFPGFKPVVAVDRKGGGLGGGGGGGHGGVGGGGGHGGGEGGGHGGVGGGGGHGGGEEGGHGGEGGGSNQVYRGPVYAGGHSNGGNLDTPVDSPHLVLLLLWIVHLFDVLHT